MQFTWLEENALVLMFYVAVALLIYFNRKRFEFQGIVAILKTKLGIKQMQNFATPLKEKQNKKGKKIFNVSTTIFIITTILMLLNEILKIQQINPILRIIFVASFISICIAIVKYKQIKPAGKLGIIIGFIGLLFMLGLIVAGVHQVIFDPDAPPMFAPVLPGISIPGSPFKLPLFEGLIALLVVVAIHEFSHGVVSKSYKIPIKSSGFVMFGPIPGAFVEPNEKKLKKATTTAQLSVYAAGPFSNMLLALFLIIILGLLTILTTSMYEPDGVKIQGFVTGQNISERNLEVLEKGEIITSLNNETIITSRDLIENLQNYTPQDEITLITNKGEKTITLGADPRNESIAYMGIYLDNHLEGKNKIAKNQIFTKTYFWVVGNPYSLNMNQNLGVLWLIFILSFGIGIVNLLPIGALDGGRMFFLVLKNKLGEKKATKILSKISIILIITIIILVFIPIIKAII